MALDEYLGKLRTMADGALTTIERREEEGIPKHQEEGIPKHLAGDFDSGRQKAWWQGYRQCLDDVRHHHEEEGNS